MRGSRRVSAFRELCVAVAYGSTRAVCGMRFAAASPRGENRTPAHLGGRRIRRRCKEAVMKTAVGRIIGASLCLAATWVPEVFAQPVATDGSADRAFSVEVMTTI